jgi:tetratricopeptide (TPR) repeat protein
VSLSEDLGEQNKTVDELLLEGRQKAMQMNYGDALQCFNEVLKIDPNNLRALNNRGNIYHTMGNDNGALRDFEKALEVDPTFIEAEYGKGLVYISLNRREEAIASFERYVANAPPDEQQQVQYAQQFLMELKGQNQSTNP